jgi:hypothetical protein
MTFHKILAGCEEGKREAWRAFLTDYTPIVLRLFEVYSPWASEQRGSSWAEALRALAADHGAPLRGFSHRSEREFLVDLRAFLLDWMVEKLDPSCEAAEPPAPTTEALTAIVEGLPLAHQEIVFLALAGYSQGTLEKILRISPAVAGEGLSRLRTHYAPVLERTEDRCLWPSAWIALGHAARAGQQKDCAPLRQLIRILDGQASWYDKSPAEHHRSSCLHCLELWTSLLEVVAWERQRKPWPAAEVEPLLAVVPLPAPEKTKPSLLARMFGK